MSDEKTVVTQDERDRLVNEKFQGFIQNLAIRTGDQPVGAIVTICWADKEAVSVAMTMGKAPPQLMMAIVDLMAKKFVQATSKIKSMINVRSHGGGEG